MTSSSRDRATFVLQGQRKFDPHRKSGASCVQNPIAAQKAALILPLVLAAMLLALLFEALRPDEPQLLPSAPIGKTVPDFVLPARGVCLSAERGHARPAAALFLPCDSV